MKKKIGNWSQKGPRDSENGEDTCNATKKKKNDLNQKYVPLY